MSDRDQPILNDGEVTKRKLLLAQLQAALTTAKIPSTLAGRQRLVLRYTQRGPQASSGLTDPALHVLGPAPNVVTTDGASYRLSDGQEFPTSEVTAAVSAIRA